MPLFCDIALAERIERGEAQLIARASRAAHDRRPDGGGFVIPVAGGVASFAEPDSPYNKVAGLGFAGVPDVQALEGIEGAFAAVGAPVQVELANLADPDIGPLLGDRGYRLESFENVLGLAVGGGRERVIPPGVEVRRAREDEVEAWLEVVVGGAAHPDVQGVPWHEEFPRETLMAAERDSVAAGLLLYRPRPGHQQWTAAGPGRAHQGPRRRTGPTAPLGPRHRRHARRHPH